MMFGVFSQVTKISHTLQYSLQVSRNHYSVNIENDYERNINVIGASLKDNNYLTEYSRQLSRNNDSLDIEDDN